MHLPSTSDEVMMRQLFWAELVSYSHLTVSWYIWFGYSVISRPRGSLDPTPYKPYACGCIQAAFASFTQAVHGSTSPFHSSGRRCEDDRRLAQSFAQRWSSPTAPSERRPTRQLPHLVLLPNPSLTSTNRVSSRRAPPAVGSPARSAAARRRPTAPPGCTRRGG